MANATEANPPSQQETEKGLIPGMRATYSDAIVTFVGILLSSIMLYCIATARTGIIERARERAERVPPLSIPAKHYSQTRHCAAAKVRDDAVREPEDMEECSICLCEFEAEDLVKELLCGHCFHADCLDRWLLVKSACPLCKRRAAPWSEDTAAAAAADASEARATTRALATPPSLMIEMINHPNHSAPLSTLNNEEGASNSRSVEFVPLSPPLRSASTTPSFFQTGADSGSSGLSRRLESAAVSRGDRAQRSWGEWVMSPLGDFTTTPRAAPDTPLSRMQQREAEGWAEREDDGHYGQAASPVASGSLVVTEAPHRTSRSAERADDDDDDDDGYDYDHNADDNNPGIDLDVISADGDGDGSQSSNIANFWDMLAAGTWTPRTPRAALVARWSRGE
jgi:hypothetical protein